MAAADQIVTGTRCVARAAWLYLRAPPSLPLPLCALPLPLVLALRPLSNRSDAPRWLSLSAHLPRSLHHACVLAGLATAVSPTHAYRYRCERTKRRRERGVSQSIDESRVSRMLDGYALSSPSRSLLSLSLSLIPAPSSSTLLAHPCFLPCFACMPLCMRVCGFL